MPRPDLDAIEKLLTRLSLREKVGQLNQRLYGWDCVRRTAVGYELTEAFHVEAERWGGIGALYGALRADAWSGRDWRTGVVPEARAEVAAMIVDATRTHSRHGIGPLLVEEAPHGHQALGGPSFPVNLNVGSSWDPQLYAECSAAVADGLRAAGIHLALVSSLDLLRDPRWGRSEECFGEDPLLSAELTTALVTGMQGANRSRLHAGAGAGVVLKHFAAQGEGVGGRNGQSAIIGPRDLAELHLPAARAGVAAGALGVMAAYNDVDGVPCCSSPALLTGLLRDDWAFDGLVMADGKAIDRLALMTGSLRRAAEVALRAGVDLSLWDTAFTLLEEAVEQDPRLLSAIDRACRRVLTVKAHFGLLDALMARPEPVNHSPAQAIELSRRMAARSLILLANDAAALPLRLPVAGGPRPRWVVVGPNADSTTAMLGDYVPPLRPQDQLSVLDALRAAAGGRVDVVHATERSDDIAGAVASADLVLCVLGGTSHRTYADEFADNGAALSGGTVATSGEGVDVADLALPGEQDQLVRLVRRATRGTVVSVVIAGRPHVLTGVLEASDATLLAWYPGPYGAPEIVRVLVGDAEPAGRLPVTLPASAGAVPVRYNDRQSAVAVYADAPEPVLRPFGFGLSYRAPTILAVRAEHLPGDDDVRVEVDVANPHDADVADVVKIFGHRTGGDTWPRECELLGFRRVSVPARDSVTVPFDLAGGRVFADTGPQAVTTISVGASGPGTTPGPACIVRRR
ncbi:glycoside hydrolase family 3 protein [Jiangella aurantiaca]|nr:glycoside hydrolase family 3 N-terminal domain-containing protein [Jiangella aurantiaca]